MSSENLYNIVRSWVLADLAELLPDLAKPILARIEVSPTREPTHGDMATNAAMIAAKPAGQNPKELSEALAARLAARPEIASAAPAGPGFVNIVLAPEILLSQIPVILAAAEGYGAGQGGKGRINVEYVSANPTGPLHVGHCRGAVVGDALANLLAKSGYDVTKEFYVNDAGAQVIALARAVYVRYLEALDLASHALSYIETISGGLQYGGTYLVPLGFDLAQKYDDRFVDRPEATWLPLFRDYAVAEMLALIKEDLAALGVTHDVFTSERALVEKGAVTRALGNLEAKGLLYTGTLEPPKGKTPDDYEPRPQQLFRATQFGDDTDRPVAKSDGSNTYFANDIAYHADKVSRGFTSMVDIWGADHGGYVKRMKAAVAAINEHATLDIVLCQIVRVVKNGEPVRMSKRAGTFVELRDLIDEVGADVVRFIMLFRKSDAQMDFDLTAAVAQTRENPVFYVNYAHARCRSVLRAAGDKIDPATDLACLTAPEETALLRRLITFPRLVEQAAEAREPHRIAFYLYDVASDFHALWNAGNANATLRFIQPDHPAETAARLALVAATAIVIRAGMAILGVTPPEEMRD